MTFVQREVVIEIAGSRSHPQRLSLMVVVRKPRHLLIGHPRNRVVLAGIDSQGAITLQLGVQSTEQVQCSSRAVIATRIVGGQIELRRLPRRKP